jgi:hypothetical protein
MSVKNSNDIMGNRNRNLSRGVNFRTIGNGDSSLRVLSSVRYVLKIPFFGVFCTVDSFSGGSGFTSTMGTASFSSEGYFLCST